MDSDDVWQHIDAERSWLADLLESLPVDGLGPAEPVRRGGRVRDVGAHLAFSHARVRDVLWPAVRTGFRYNAMIKYSAVRSPLGHEQIVATLRGFVGSRRKAPMVTDLEPLLDILVHTQDICRPLGIEHPMPPRRGRRGRGSGARPPRPIRLWKPHGVSAWSPPTPTGPTGRAR